ncbi:1-acyl-sn-glycerol-3-phosphate acyltransferase [Patescibacteria group bacterium]|nr:1-acyl-sn-glycerol-3-phosphate acyltransferase [Patescibacteria group bacterium]
MYSLYPYPIFRKMIFPFFRFLIKDVKGEKNLPEKGPYIVVANHRSAFDPYFMSTLIIPRIKRKVNFFSVKVKYLSFPGNWLARQWAGCIIVDPKNKGESVKQAIRFLKRKKVVGIFPEGRSHKEKTLLKSKTGLARILIEENVPVIPVGINNTISTSFEKAFFQTFFLRSGRVSISIGEPIRFDSNSLPKEADKEELDKITRVVMREIGKLANLPYNY